MPLKYAAVMDSDNTCDEVCDLFNEGFEQNEHLNVLNRLTHCCQGFTDEQMEQFHTVFAYIGPQTLEEAVQLAENLRDFTIVSGIHTAEDYSKVIAERAGNCALSVRFSGLRPPRPALDQLRGRPV